MLGGGQRPCADPLFARPCGAKLPLAEEQISASMEKDRLGPAASISCEFWRRSAPPRRWSTAGCGNDASVGTYFHHHPSALEPVPEAEQVKRLEALIDVPHIGSFTSSTFASDGAGWAAAAFGAATVAHCQRQLMQPIVVEPPTVHGPGRMRLVDINLDDTYPGAAKTPPPPSPQLVANVQSMHGWVQNFARRISRTDETCDQEEDYFYRVEDTCKREAEFDDLHDVALDVVKSNQTAKDSPKSLTGDSTVKEEDDRDRDQTRRAAPSPFAIRASSASVDSPKALAANNSIGMSDQNLDTPRSQCLSSFPRLTVQVLNAHSLEDPVTTPPVGVVPPCVPPATPTTVTPPSNSTNSSCPSSSSSPPHSFLQLQPRISPTKSASVARAYGANACLPPKLRRQSLTSGLQPTISASRRISDTASGYMTRPSARRMSDHASGFSYIPTVAPTPSMTRPRRWSEQGEQGLPVGSPPGIKDLSVQGGPVPGLLSRSPGSNSARKPSAGAALRPSLRSPALLGSSFTCQPPQGPAWMQAHDTPPQPAPAQLPLLSHVRMVPELSGSFNQGTRQLSGGLSAGLEY